MSLEDLSVGPRFFILSTGAMMVSPMSEVRVLLPLPRRTTQTGCPSFFCRFLRIVRPFPDFLPRWSVPKPGCRLHGLHLQPIIRIFNHPARPNRMSPSGFRLRFRGAPSPAAGGSGAAAAVHSVRRRGPMDDDSLQKIPLMNIKAAILSVLALLCSLCATAQYQ